MVQFQLSLSSDRNVLSGCLKSFVLISGP